MLLLVLLEQLGKPTEKLLNPRLGLVLDLGMLLSLLGIDLDMEQRIIQLPDLGIEKALALSLKKLLFALMLVDRLP